FSFDGRNRSASFDRAKQRIERLDSGLNALFDTLIDRVCPTQRYAGYWIAPHADEELQLCFTDFITRHQLAAAERRKPSTHPPTGRRPFSGVVASQWRR